MNVFMVRFGMVQIATMFFIHNPEARAWKRSEATRARRSPEGASKTRVGAAVLLVANGLWVPYERRKGGTLRSPPSGERLS